MQSAEAEPVNATHNYRPICSKCGVRTALARIEPTGEPGYDLRTFECLACGNLEQIEVKYR